MCRTTSTAASRPEGRVDTRARSASTPPAEAPMTTTSRWATAPPLVVGSGARRWHHGAPTARCFLTVPAFRFVKQRVPAAVVTKRKDERMTGGDGSLSGRAHDLDGEVHSLRRWLAEGPARLPLDS